jgi:pimeloyl-ACP methyl ester carboxylesterase
VRWTLALVLVLGGCARERPEREAAPLTSAAPAAPVPGPRPATPASVAKVTRALEAEEVPVDGDLPVFVVRGTNGGRTRTVFLTGSCTHPTEVLSSFRRAGAMHGGVVALQGDLPCKTGDGRLRKWSADTRLTTKRIDDALHALGVTETDDLTLIGYSQGAERAEWLANRFPAKYTRFILVAGPVPPAPARLSGALAVVTMAGKGDEREHMWMGAKRLRSASTPATYIEIPSRHHGQVDPEADALFAHAFDWLDENARTRKPRAARRR